MSDLRSVSVRHILWGEGQIIRREDNVLTVRFAQQGEKEFLYPDAFDKHLKLSDPGEAPAVMDDLARRQAELLNQKMETARRLAEIERQRAEEKERQAAEKRKARTSRAKKTPGTAAAAGR